MKKSIGLLCLLVCIGCGVFYCCDLILNTDPMTGLLQEGSVWLRYLLLAVPAVLIGLASLAFDGCSDRQLPPGSCIPAFCGLLFSGIVGIGLYFFGHGGIGLLISGVLFVTGGIWFAAYLIRDENAGLFWVFGGIVGWIIIIIRLFLIQVSSVQHLTATVELVCCLGCLCGFLGLVLAGYTPLRPGSGHRIFFYGTVCFFYGFCILLPQEIWLFCNKSAPAFFQGKGIAAGALGLAGCIAALRATDFDAPEDGEWEAPLPADFSLSDALSALEEPDPFAPQQEEEPFTEQNTLDAPTEFPAHGAFFGENTLWERAQAAVNGHPVQTEKPTESAAFPGSPVPARPSLAGSLISQLYPNEASEADISAPAQEAAARPESKTDPARQNTAPRSEQAADPIDALLKGLQKGAPDPKGKPTTDGKWVFKG